MGALMRSHDWSKHPLGPPGTWPQALRTAARLMLNTRHQMCLFWGSESFWFYNDAYRQTLTAERHPASLGAPGQKVWPEIWGDIGPQITQVLAGGDATWHENQHLFLHRNGRQEDTYWTYSYGPIDDESAPHGVGGVLGVCTETTGQVLATLRAAQERRHFAELFEQAPSFMAMLRGPEHIFELANPSYLRLIGHRDLLGRSVKEALPDAAAQGFVALLDAVYRNGEPHVATSTRFLMQTAADAPVSERCLDFVFQPIKNPSGCVTGIFVEGTDVTERTLAEKALRASETRLRNINADLEQQVAERMHGRARTWQLTTDLLGILNSEGFFEASNPAWQQVLGWSEAKIASTHFSEFLHPDDLAPNQLAFARAIELGEPALRIENRYRHSDGGYRWLSWVAIPEANKVYCSARDITAEKQAAEALTRTEAALRQAQKMEAVGQLTGGLAHDFNNLLGGIMDALEASRMKLEKGQLDDIPRYLSLGDTAVRRAAALTQRLLAFSRQQTLDPRSTDINQLITGMEDLIRGTIGHAIGLEIIDVGDLWSCLVDPPQLENALLNLCINARDAMPDGGCITIRTANHSLDAQAAAAFELVPGEYVSMSVTDTGAGMTADVIARAFDPFFTTKPIGRGTGLGLSMIYGFAQQSGGQARIYSKPGAGTTVSLYLPRHYQAPVEPNAPVLPPPIPSTVKETILVVEDEPSIRELVDEVLTDAGYTVFKAGDAGTGLLILQSSIPIDLLVSDVGLPGAMNGRQMADLARTSRKNLKVLFMTGYAESLAIGKGHMDSDMHVLAKPFSLSTLTQRIRQILD